MVIKKGRREMYRELVEGNLGVWAVVFLVLSVIFVASVGQITEAPDEDLGTRSCLMLYWPKPAPSKPVRIGWQKVAEAKTDPFCKGGIHFEPASDTSVVRFWNEPVIVENYYTVTVGYITFKGWVPYMEIANWEGEIYVWEYSLDGSDPFFDP